MTRLWSNFNMRGRDAVITELNQLDPEQVKRFREDLRRLQSKADEAYFDRENPMAPFLWTLWRWVKDYDNASEQPQRRMPQLNVARGIQIDIPPNPKLALNQQIDQALRQVPAGQPLILRLQAGATYDLNADVMFERSHITLTRYGQGTRPLIRGHGNSFNLIRGEDHIRFEGLHYIVNESDVYTLKKTGEIGFRITRRATADGPSDQVMGPVVWLDCEIENASQAISVSHRSNVVVRGCDIHNNQIGVFAHNIHGLTIEDCALYRNGSINDRCHNIYAGYLDSRDFTIRRNLLGTSSGYAVKLTAGIQGITIENNFYTGTALGLIVHNNHPDATPDALVTNLVIRNNVGIENGRRYQLPNGTWLGRQTMLKVDYCVDYQITHNLYAHASVGGVNGVLCVGDDPKHPAGPRIIANNMIDDTTCPREIYTTGSHTVFEANVFSRHNCTASTTAAVFDATGQNTYRDNIYPPSPVFMLSGVSMNPSQWKASGRDIHGDNNAPKYVDPDRSIASFLEQAPGTGDLYDRYVRNEFQLDQLLDYFRDGYKTR